MTRMLRYAQETDYVGIAPISNPRAYNDVIGNQIKLPNDEENSAQQVAEIISAAKWKKQIKVRPRRKEEISAVACVNLGEHFWPEFVNLDEHFCPEIDAYGAKVAADIDRMLKVVDDDLEELKAEKIPKLPKIYRWHHIPPQW